MEMIKETRIKIALTAFTLDQYINILAIKSSELESLVLFYNNFPCVSSTLIDNWTQSLIDFKNCLILLIAHASSDSFIQNSLT